MWCFVIGAALAAPLTVDDVVRRALESSPAAIAAESELDALRGLRRSRSLFLQNPSVEVEAVDGLVSGEAIQPLSIEGWAARSEARALTDAAEASRARVRLEVAAEARTAWADAVIASARADAVRESLDLSARLREAVEERARVGDASALDAALARSSEAEAIVRSLEARRARTNALTAVAAFHPDAIDLGVAGDPISAVPTPTGGPESRSDVAAMSATVEARAADLRRQRVAAVPALGAGVVFDDEGNVGPKGVLQVPLWNRNQAATGEARAALAGATADLETLRAVAASQQRLGTEQAVEARSLRTRLDGFDAQSKEALGYAAVAYERGEIDVRDVVLLQGELLDGRLAALDAAALAIAMEIEALLAVDDPGLLPGGTP